MNKHFCFVFKDEHRLKILPIWFAQDKDYTASPHYSIFKRSVMTNLLLLLVTLLFILFLTAFKLSCPERLARQHRVNLQEISLGSSSYLPPSGCQLTGTIYCSCQPTSQIFGIIVQIRLFQTVSCIHFIEQTSDADRVSKCEAISI